jgi:Fe2+ transport system protein FeoA
MDNPPNHRQQRQRIHQRGKFTFLGETAANPGKNWARGNFTPEQTPSQLKTFPLSTTQVGDRVVIKKILTNESMIGRLSKIGFTVGSAGQVISHTKSGSVIIYIQQESIGLGAAIANQIMVTVVTEA